MMKLFLYILLASQIMLSSCTKIVNKNNDTEKKVNEQAKIDIPIFSADSAYNFIQQQVDFGARVPNSEAHKACGIYLENKLTEYGAKVIIQEADLIAFDGTVLKSKNIIASYQPESKDRIILFAHWDTRPWADHDAEINKRREPVLGANDGASGVGVLLEIARIFNEQLPAIGVDIILFDAEDYGAPEDLSSYETNDSWCLGSQYWSKNKHKPGYRARYGILLDMVGGKNAQFYREQISDYFAKSLVDKVWKKASELGFEYYFVNKQGGSITDDHLYVNKIAKIPSIDIIQYDPNSESGFGHFWHTTNDTMENIDKNTLHAVGTTLLHIIFNEK